VIGKRVQTHVIGNGGIAALEFVVGRKFGMNTDGIRKTEWYRATQKQPQRISLMTFWVAIVEPIMGRMANVFDVGTRIRDWIRGPKSGINPILRRRIRIDRQ
jgi:hypothetical protein